MDPDKTFLGLFFVVASLLILSVMFTAGGEPEQVENYTVFETIRPICFTEIHSQINDFTCEGNSCEVSINLETFDGGTQSGTVSGGYETLSLNGKSVNLFSCDNGFDTFYHVTSSNFQEITESNYSSVVGPIVDSVDAYYALIVLKHPAQLSRVVNTSENLELAHSGSVVGNQFDIDKKIVSQSENCTLFQPNFSFSGYPFHKEVSNQFVVKRVWHNDLDYFHETALITREGNFITHNTSQVMGCQ